MAARFVERGLGGLDAGRPGEVEDGQGGGGERDAVPGAEIRAADAGELVEADTGTWAQAAADRDVDLGTVIRHQPPESGGSQVGKGGGGPARHHRSQQVRPQIGRSVADSVDATVDAVERAPARPAMDRAMAEPERLQLPARDQTVLEGGNPGDALITATDRGRNAAWVDRGDHDAT